jgi:hypothetical protein
MMPLYRNAHRPTLATVLVIIVGLSIGLDAAIAVALSVAVMEVDARRS